MANRENDYGRESYGGPDWNREEWNRGSEYERGRGVDDRGRGWESQRYESEGTGPWRGREGRRGEWEGGGYGGRGEYEPRYGRSQYDERDFGERSGREWGAGGGEYSRGGGRWSERPTYYGGSGGYGGGGYGSGAYGGYGRGAPRGYRGEDIDRGGPRYGEQYDQRGYQSQGYQGYESQGYQGSPEFQRGQYRESQYGGYGSRGQERYGEESRGRFTGRGPKGYRRSDERIREDVNERLTMHPDVDASDVEVRVNEGTVTLTGVVEDRRQKRLAEDIVEDIFGVDDVRNELKVRHGFLATLTGEKASDREISRAAARESRETGESRESREEGEATRRGGGSATTRSSQST